MSKIHPVILCGGGGTRLWPRSRQSMPKPFLPLVGERTLFQQSCDRVADEEKYAAPIVVSGAEHRSFVEAQAGQLGELIVEPEGRNTAPAIGLAAHRLPTDAIMLICPSDHYIGNLQNFHAAIAEAEKLAGDNWLVSFGITPDRAETGYGYLKAGEPLATGRRIAEFVEKPDLATAETFLADGGYAWNAGIFAFRAGTFLEELARHRPEMAEALVHSVEAGETADHLFQPAAEPFQSIKGESVDYAIMENTGQAAMIDVDMDWSDVGNWQALQDILGNDEHGNHVRGRADLKDCSSVMVDSDGPRVSAIGLSDVVIVVDGDEVLVTSRDGAQLVGKLPGASSQ